MTRQEWLEQFEVCQAAYGSLRWTAALKGDWQAVGFYRSRRLIKHPSDGVPPFEDWAKGFKSKRLLLAAMNTTFDMLEESQKEAQNESVRN